MNRLVLISCIITFDIFSFTLTNTKRKNEFLLLLYYYCLNKYMLTLLYIDFVYVQSIVLLCSLTFMAMSHTTTLEGMQIAPSFSSDGYAKMKNTSYVTIRKK